MSDFPQPRLPDEPIDAALIALDMDGTLVDGDGLIPEAFWPLVTRFREQGAVIVAASGRQYATLHHLFGDQASQMGFIAENGALVVLEDEVLATDTMAPEIVADMLATARVAGESRNLGVVLCGVRSAYIERTDAAFRSEVDIYYHELAEVEDLGAVDDDVLKIAVYDFDGSEQGAATFFEPYRDTHQVVVSGQHWVDLMNAGVHKGSGIDLLRERLGLGRDQCVAFGDYLNDLQMLEAVDHSYAMANAHPDILAVAAYIAPANTEHGVVTALEQLLA